MAQETTTGAPRGGKQNEAQKKKKKNKTLL